MCGKKTTKNSHAIISWAFWTPTGYADVVWNRKWMPTVRSKLSLAHHLLRVFYFVNCFLQGFILRPSLLFPTSRFCLLNLTPTTDYGTHLHLMPLCKKSLHLDRPQIHTDKVLWPRPVCVCVSLQASKKRELFLREETWGQGSSWDPQWLFLYYGCCQGTTRCWPAGTVWSLISSPSSWVRFYY